MWRPQSKFCRVTTLKSKIVLNIWFGFTIFDHEPELSAPQTCDDFIICFFGEFPNI